MVNTNLLAVGLMIGGLIGGFLIGGHFSAQTDDAIRLTAEINDKNDSIRDLQRQLDDLKNNIEQKEISNKLLSGIQEILEQLPKDQQINQIAEFETKLQTALDTGSDGGIPPPGKNIETYGPTSYQSFSRDSPFAQFEENSKYFYLEDFEDGFLNTPGVTGDGSVQKNESVDEDDKLVDGSGREGSSYHQNPYYSGVYSLTFKFDKNTLGEFPNYVGIVFTDIGNTAGGGGRSANFIFEAYGIDGFSIGTVGPSKLGDGYAREGGTSEDTFFGIKNDDGITAVKFYPTSKSFAFYVDHLQYGKLN